MSILPITNLQGKSNFTIEVDIKTSSAGDGGLMIYRPDMSNTFYGPDTNWQNGLNILTETNGSGVNYTSTSLSRSSGANTDWYTYKIIFNGTSLTINIINSNGVIVHNSTQSVTSIFDSSSNVCGFGISSSWSGGNGCNFRNVKAYSN